MADDDEIFKIHPIGNALYDVLQNFAEPCGVEVVSSYAELEEADVSGDVSGT